MKTRRPSSGSATRTNRPWSQRLLIQRRAVVGGTAAAMHRLETATRCLSTRAAIRSSSMSQAGSANSSLPKKWSRSRRTRMIERMKAASSARLRGGRRDRGHRCGRASAQTGPRARSRSARLLAQLLQPHRRLDLADSGLAASSSRHDPPPKAPQIAAVRSNYRCTNGPFRTQSVLPVRTNSISDQDSSNIGRRAEPAWSAGSCLKRG